MITYKPNFKTYIIETPLKLVDLHNARKFLTSDEYKAISNSFSVFSCLGGRNTLQNSTRILDLLKDNEHLGNSKYYIMIILFPEGKLHRKIWTAKNMIKHIYRIDLITKEHLKYLKKRNQDIIVTEKPNIPEKDFTKIILYSSLTTIKYYEKGLTNASDAAYYMSNHNYSTIKLSIEKGLI